MNLELPRIYPITDARVSGISHCEQVKRLISGGAEIVQLRDKYAPPRDFYESALKAVEIAKSRNVSIIINDRVDIALASNADGVHLGQDDMSPDAARLILGENAIIGFSTHSLEQAISAITQSVDYIALGPIFETSTKADPDAVVGLEGLRRVREAIGDLTLVAIGGIDQTNLRSVIEAGADSAAMIGALLSDPQNIESRMREFIGLPTIAC